MRWLRQVLPKKIDPGLGRTVARLLQQTQVSSHIGQRRMSLIFAPSAVSGLHLIKQRLSLTFFSSLSLDQLNEYLKDLVDAGVELQRCRRRI